MRPLRHILPSIILATVTCIMSATDKHKNLADTTTARAGYPQRLITEFPVIYADTAYTTPHYNIVVRAVWMVHKHRRCKISTPDQLPEPPGAKMIRFTRHPLSKRHFSK